MNTTLRTWFVMLAAAVVFACGGNGGDDAADAAQEAAEEVEDVREAVEEATEEAAEAMEAAGDAMSESKDEAITVIDHSKDEAEFRVKQTLAGVEGLIEDIQAEGGDTSELEARKEELEEELESL